MKLETLILGSYRANCYIIHDGQSGEALIIDPGDQPQMIIQRLKEKSLKPVGIILTHHHRDHVGGVRGVVELYGCPVYIHKKDLKGLNGGNSLPQAVSRLRDGDTIVAGQITLEVVHTPGHTPGSICLQVVGQKAIFTGDTIFIEGVGRTDLEGGDLDAMHRSLVEKVNQWPDNLIIYPGHDQSATMATVRKGNRTFSAIIAKAQQT